MPGGRRRGPDLPGLAEAGDSFTGEAAAAMLAGARPVSPPLTKRRLFGR